MSNKVTRFISKVLKSKTVIFMVLAAIVPVLDLLGQIDLKEILVPIMCGDTPTVECIEEGPEKIYAKYTVVVASIGTFLRFLTKDSISDKK